jgi:hypothetical protein
VAWLHIVPGGQGQSVGQLSQLSSGASQTMSPQLALPQSMGQVVLLSMIAQQPSPQTGVAQSVWQVQLLSVGPQQPSMHTSTVQSAAQLQPFSPPSQDPSPQPSHVPPMHARPGGQVQSMQLLQSSPGSHAELPHSGMQSPGQSAAFSGPEQQPSPQEAVAQSAGQLQAFSPGSQGRPSPSKSLPHPEHW